MGSKTIGELPEKLRDERVKPSVKQLWYRGEWSEQLFAKCVAVVGSRRMSRYGKQVLGEMVPRLCSAGYTIVSGLMYGVDQEAHRLCLEEGGVAIAVLGYGIEYQSEEGAMKMAEQIEQRGGLIISEYPGETVCQRWMFPQRNRIVVGLADLVIIAEAGEKSGTLSTADWAQKMGKPIYAVPGSVFSDTSEGANWLIAEGRAKTLSKTVLDELCGGESIKPSRGEVEIASEEDRLIAVSLRVNGPVGVNELARNLGRPVGEILARLMQMELRGLVAEERGVWKVYS